MFNPIADLYTLPKFVTGTDPAAGAEISQTVPAGKYWQLLAVAFTMVQGLTNTPLPSLLIDDGTNLIYQAPCASSAMSVSTTARFFVAPGLTLGAGAANTVVNSPLPEGLVLPPGSRIRTSTTSLAATGNYGAPLIHVVEYG